MRGGLYDAEMQRGCQPESWPPELDMWDVGFEPHAWTAALDDEHTAQIQKWGSQRRTPFEWMTYLTEEVGELAAALSEYVYRNGEPENIRDEAVQVATLALKIAHMTCRDT